MERYSKTLKQYTHLHSHYRLTAHQKMDLVEQIFESMSTIHRLGIAHRDISEVNFMVSESKNKILKDGSKGADLYMIDFGKAVLTRKEDVVYWWIERPKIDGEYDGQMQPEDEKALKLWCDKLPWVTAKPDHGYRHNRSIQTLPKTRGDTSVLPWLIHPIAEDMYSISTVVWKIFAETEPWHGILDTDLRGLRDTVKDNYRIERSLEREVAGELSQKLLLHCLKTDPVDRHSADDVIRWMSKPDVREGLIKE
ncbi:hypothetical protein J3Q64DRAFT_1619682, partial [Phycomyces blakesleeanus]